MKNLEGKEIEWQQVSNRVKNRSQIFWLTLLWPGYWISPAHPTVFSVSLCSLLTGYGNISKIVWPQSCANFLLPLQKNMEMLTYPSYVTHKQLCDDKPNLGGKKSI